MAAIDYARLRDQTMADGFDSEVTVNTRALIDKVSLGCIFISHLY